MSQFDVYANATRRPEPALVPYVVALQSDLLDAIENHVVAPLRLKADQIHRRRRAPEPDHDRRQTIPGARAGHRNMPRSLLKKPVTNLSAQRDEILAALDFLFTGF
jgi:toxin CcdB